MFPMTSIYYRVSKKRDPTHPALESLKEQLHALALTCKQEAIILLHSKKHEAALKKVHQGLELVPEDLDLILIKAEAWMHLAKEKDALALLQPLDSLAAKSLSTKILIKWVRRLMDSKNYSEALPLVKLLVSSDSMYILLLGEVLVNLKLYKEVLDLDLPSTCSFLHTAHLELGKECYDTHQWSEAKDHFEKAWQISKTSNLALMLANTFIHIEKDMALAYLNEALLLDPENKQAKDKHLVWVGQFEKQVGKHSLEPTHLQVATYSDKRRFS
ncbi:hypothetical protein HMI54_008329 [Coelomomyces lativittatus]|nr:hypothetical protein HMI54_008329 [Coelomomyces lativittatus]